MTESLAHLPPPQVPSTQSALAASVSQFVAHGWRVESQTTNQAVLVYGRRPNHVLHLILTLVTFGFWGLFVWLPLSVFMHEKRRTLTVDPWGRVV